MSIKSELNKTAEFLRRTRKAILGRGGEISPDAGMKDLPEAIFNIPADTSLAFYEDEETAYQKTVPNGAEEYALLNSVGGMSYKSNNLIPFPYVHTTNTMNGITFTDNGDGSLTITGTASASAVFILQTNCNYGDAAINAMSSESATNGLYAASKLLYYNPANGILSINIVSGATIQETLYPMLNKGNVLLPYEPYYEGLRDTKVTEIVSYGKNLFDADNIIKGSFEPKGGFMSGDHLLRTSEPISIIGGETYVVSCNPSYDLRYLYFYDSDNEYISSMWMGRPTNHFYKFTAPTDARFVNIGFEIDGATSGTVIDLSAAKTNSEMQLERGSVNTEYKPYREPITYPIPEEVQVSKGVGNYCDTIDFENGKKIQKCNTIVFDGTESWFKYGSEGEHSIFRVTIKGKMQKHQSSICSHFKNVNNIWGLGYGFQAGSYSDNTNEVVYFRTTQADVNEWKNYLKEQHSSGNPVILTYALAEPIITDILTDDNFLSVEGGGSLEFANEHEYAVPSTVKYTVKVGG